MQAQLSFRQLPMGLLRSKSLDADSLAGCLKTSSSCGSCSSVLRGAASSLRSRGSGSCGRRGGGGSSCSDREEGRRALAAARHHTHGGCCS
jgi:hypothetical protein